MYYIDSGENKFIFKRSLCFLTPSSLTKLQYVFLSGVTWKHFHVIQCILLPLTYTFLFNLEKFVII